jgi:hypothetical protein
MKRVSNRQVKTDETGREIEFFFPKPTPRTIIARTREEAEEKLAALDNK